MTIARISRVVVSIAALLFLGVALAFWVSPEQTTLRLGIETARSAGVVALRAELGGLFAGLALVCGAALSAGRRTFAVAAALMLAAIVCGRSIGWIANGGPAGDTTALAIELGVLAALIATVRSSASSAPDPSRRIARRAAIAIVAIILVVGGVSAAMLSPAASQALFGSDRIEIGRVASVRPGRGPR